MNYLFEKYVEKIKKLPNGEIDKEDILNFNFLLSEEKKMKVYYAPHNEYTNRKAKIIIVGICPGWTQTEIAYKTAKQDLENKVTIEEILKHCKKEARFAGSMRKNLIDMLDELNLPKKLNVSSFKELFEKDGLLHTTSLIPYPVFVEGKNYTGHTPTIIQSQLLMEYVKNHFYKEIKSFEQPPMIIPLGKAVEDVLKLMIQENIITDKQCLFGFPHPSGANGHRKEEFLKNKNLLIDKINLYFSE